MIIKNKFNFKKLLNTQGQALLLVLLVSIASMTVVIAVVDRTNKQVTIQRQNAGYEEAFNYAQSATEALINRIAAFIIDPTDPNVNNTINSQIVSVLNLNYKGKFNISIDPFDLAADVPLGIAPDKTLTVKNFKFSKTSTTPNTSYVNNFTISCPSQDVSSNIVPNLAIIIQILYWDAPSSSYKTDNLATTCQEDNNNTINGGLYWATNNSTIPASSESSNHYSVSSNPNGNSPILTYVIKDASNNNTSLNIDYIRVTPKTKFNNLSNNKLDFVVKMKAPNSTIIGSSNPITGIATGYGDPNNNRTSTLSFKIPNTSQLPSYLDYVLFEGNQ